MKFLDTPFYARENITHVTVHHNHRNTPETGIHLSPMDCVAVIFIFWAVFIPILFFTKQQQEEQCPKQH